MRSKHGFVLAIHLFFFSVLDAQSPDTMIVHFEYAQSGLGRADSLSIVHRFDILKGFLSSITISGHTDSRGSHAYNDSLSLKRAETVRTLLGSRGIPDSLFGMVRGYGKRQPLNDNRDAQKQAQNRRVEIVFSTRLAPIGEAVRPAGGMVRLTDSAETIPADSATTVPILTLREALKDTTTTSQQNIVLRDVNFYGGRHMPLPLSYLELDELVKVMKTHPGMKIEIQGHVCCVADDLDGEDFDTRSTDLSVKRALFVYKYLILKGVKADRMTYKGYGASRKLYPEERTALEQALNRRVEVKVIHW